MQTAKFVTIYCEIKFL